MTTRKPNTATKIRRALNKGKSPSEVARLTGASLGYVYAIKSQMVPPVLNPEPKPAPNPVKIEVPLIPFAPIPQNTGIAGLKNEPPQPIAAEAVVELVEEAVIEKPDNSKYLWVAGVGILLLVLIMLWYFGHRG